MDERSPPPPPPTTADFVYYGISPWESEVAYGYFNSKFKVTQREIEPDDDDFVSFMRVTIPVRFSEEFFKWFGFRRWEKVKALFKEMKRRRGSGNALRIEVVFGGAPSIRFVVDVGEKQLFGNAVEKMDFVLELIPYQLVPEKLPEGTDAVTYRFDAESARWRIRSASAGGIEYAHSGGGWQRPAA